MELGGEGGIRLTFQFDFKPVQVGIYFWCIGSNLNETLASKATFFITDNGHSPAAVADIKALAKQNHTRLAAKMQDHFDSAGPEAACWTTAWCEDLAVLGRQIAVEKQLQWLRPLTMLWGKEAAADALRGAHQVRTAIEPDLRAAYPAIFEKVTHGEALVVWQADMLERTRHRPRPHDQTFAVTRYRETTGDGITYLETMERPGELAGLPVRVRELTTCIVLNSWLVQQERTRTDLGTSLTESAKCTILASILGALGDARTADPAAGVGAARRERRLDPAGARGSEPEAGSPQPPLRPAPENHLADKRLHENRSKPPSGGKIRPGERGN